MAVSAKGLRGGLGEEQGQAKDGTGSMTAWQAKGKLTLTDASRLVLNAGRLFRTTHQSPSALEWTAARRGGAGRGEAEAGMLQMAATLQGQMSELQSTVTRALQATSTGKAAPALPQSVLATQAKPTPAPPPSPPPCNPAPAPPQPDAGGVATGSPRRGLMPSRWKLPTGNPLAAVPPAGFTPRSVSGAEVSTRCAGTGKDKGLTLRSEAPSVAAVGTSGDVGLSDSASGVSSASGAPTVSIAAAAPDGESDGDLDDITRVSLGRLMLARRPDTSVRRRR